MMRYRLITEKEVKPWYVLQEIYARLVGDKILEIHPSLGYRVEMYIEMELPTMETKRLRRKMKSGFLDFSSGIPVTSENGRVGRIYDPKEGWKSSFFYVREGVCVEDGNGSRIFRVRADTNSPVINFRGSVRTDSKTWDSESFERVQDCPRVFPESDLVFWLAVLVPIAVILAGIVWHARVTREKVL